MSEHKKNAKKPVNPKPLGFKAEFSKLKGMSGREKLDHIWEYYRLHIFLILIVIFMVGYFINALVLNPAKKPYLELALRDAPIFDEKRTLLAQDLGAALIPEDMRDGYEVSVDDFFLVPDSDQYNMMLLQKFTAMLVTKEIKLILFGEPSLLEMGDQGIFADMSLIFDAADMDAHRDQFLRMAFANLDDMTGGGTGEEYPCALKLDENGFFAEYGIDGAGMYLAAVAGGEDGEAVREALYYIMGW